MREFFLKFLILDKNHTSLDTPPLFISNGVFLTTVESLHNGDTLVEPWGSWDRRKWPLCRDGRSILQNAECRTPNDSEFSD